MCECCWSFGNRKKKLNKKRHQKLFRKCGKYYKCVLKFQKEKEQNISLGYRAAAKIKIYSQKKEKKKCIFASCCACLCVCAKIKRKIKINLYKSDISNWLIGPRIKRNTTQTDVEMNKSCARCTKIVYPIEELKCLDKVSATQFISKKIFSLWMKQSDGERE